MLIPYSMKSCLEAKFYVLVLPLMLPNKEVWYSKVNNTFTPRAAWRDFHRFETNIFLLSDVMHYSSPKSKPLDLST